jgi:glycosyltransferase involved in cell wall biosynthesis
MTEEAMIKNSINDNKPIVVCEMANYAADFYGNFMHSLFNLEKRGSGKLIYVFYKNTEKCRWAHDMIQEGKNVFFLSNKRLRGYIELRRLVKAFKIDIFHLHFTVPVIIIILLKMLNRNLKIIVHYHNLFSGLKPISFKNNLIYLVKAFLYNIFVDRICGCSRAVCEDLVNFRMNRKKCLYIDNGIAFSRLDKPCEDGKKLYKLTKKNVLMIYGTFFYTKGVDIAILSIRDIIDKYNIVLMIICQNRDFVVSQIKKTLGSVPDWILVLPSQENIAFYFKMSDVFLSPSREEGFSYALLESIYCGTLTIRSDLPGMDRGLPDELVVPVNNIPALREKIEFALNTPPDFNRSLVLAKQREYIIANFPVEKWSGEIYNLYTNVLKAGR